MLPKCFYDNLCVIELLFHGPYCSGVVRMALVISSAVPQCWTLWLMASGSQFHLWESVTLARSRKSPTCYSSDCDRAMYFLCFGEPLRSFNSFQIAPCLAEVPIPSRNLFKKGVYELNGQDCHWGRRRNKWGGESGHSKETEKSGMYISETYGWKL